VYVRTRRDSETLAAWLRQQGFRTAAYHAGLSPDQRRQIEQAWLTENAQFVVCTNAFGMGINKPNVRWIVHFHPPSLLSEYVQEVGRAGRDGKPAVALTLISETTGLLDPEDKQRRQFFQQQEHQQRQLAQQLVKQLPIEGDVNTVARQYPHGLIALSLLHSAGQLAWSDPFHYVINRSAVPQPISQSQSAQRMLQFIGTRQCRWQFILDAFGCSQDAASLGKGCGHCDRCHRHA